MEYKKITKENILNEHICCAISNNDDIQVSSKKEWIKDRLDEGLVFLKADTRGKCFIEYLPAEYAWVPIEADGYMYIDCFWVSGSLKNHGYASGLLNMCIADSKEKKKKGICVLSSDKKRPFLSDPKFLKYKGFMEADKSSIGINLYYLPFEENAVKPSFSDIVDKSEENNEGYVLYYTHQCPFTAKYVPIIEDLAKQKGVSFRTVYISNREEARKLPSPCTTYVLFYNGKFVTNEILSEKKFLEITGQ